LTNARHRKLLDVGGLVIPRVRSTKATPIRNPEAAPPPAWGTSGAAKHVWSLNTPSPPSAPVATSTNTGTDRTVAPDASCRSHTAACGDVPAHAIAAGSAAYFEGVSTMMLPRSVTEPALVVPLATAVPRDVPAGIATSTPYPPGTYTTTFAGPG
jgi:hypothetical protein